MRVVLITAVASVGCLGIAGVIGLSTGLFVPGIGASSGVPVDQRRSAPLAGLQQITVDTVSADVRVAVTDGDAVEAWLHGTAASGASADPPRLDVEQVGSSLRVSVHPQRRFAFDFTWSRLALDVSIPRAYAQRVSVKSVSGTINTGDAQWAELALASTSGEIHTGRIRAARCQVGTVSGAIRLDGVDGDARLHSTSGEISAAFTAPPAAVEATSTSGAVTLRLPSESQFTLDARSTSGDITCGFPVTLVPAGRERGHHAVNATVGAGTGRVLVRTVSGAIRVSP